MDWHEQCCFDMPIVISLSDARENKDFAKFVSLFDCNLKLMTLKNEMDHQQPALECRMFSVTYGFLGSVSPTKISIVM